MFDRYSFKEKNRVQNIIKSGLSTHYTTSDLILLAAHYYRQGYVREAVKDIILSFCSIHIENFAYEMYFKAIDIALNKGAGRGIVHVDSLPIYKEELDYIKGLGVDEKHSQLLFTIYCYKKLLLFAYPNNNNNNIGLLFGKSNRQRQDIKKISCIKVKNNLEYQIMYHNFVTKGLFKPLSQGENFLECFTNMPKGKILLYNPVYFDNIGLLYEHYLGNNKIKICTKCNSPYREYSKTKPTKTCKECSKYEKQKIIQKKCIDCGKIFFVSAKANKVVRCADCQKRNRQKTQKNTKKA